MKLDELRKLNPKDVASWPLLPKLLALGCVFVLIVGAGYWFVWQHQLDELEAAKKNEEELRTTFLEKKKKAINLEAYRKQLADIEQSFGALLKQLPNKSEMDALLTDINQAGLGRGLQFELFRPAAQESMSDFYAELPITLKVSGNYHDMQTDKKVERGRLRLVLLESIGKAFVSAEVPEYLLRKVLARAALNA